MIPEVTWKVDANVEAARRLPGWKEFHLACAAQRLFFDHPEKRGRAYEVAVFSGSGRETRRHCTGTGKTVIDALDDGYRQVRLRIPDADTAMARMRAGPVADDDDFDSLIADDFEELLK